MWAKYPLATMVDTEMHGANSAYADRAKALKSNLNPTVTARSRPTTAYRSSFATTLLAGLHTRSRAR
jgi:hypothetical protein